MRDYPSNGGIGKALRPGSRWLKTVELLRDWLVVWAVILSAHAIDQTHNPSMGGPVLVSPFLLPDNVFQFEIRPSEALSLIYSISRSPDLTQWTMARFTEPLDGPVTVQERAGAAHEFFRVSAAQPNSIVIVTNYHGWSDALLLSNGQIEVMVVPSIGRVMQVRFAGEQTGPVWENHSLDGQLPNPNATDWQNFGGDKTWPAPQADWPRVTGRSWPPPAAFDSLSLTARTERGTVLLTSPVDAKYGIRTIRRVEVHPSEPRLQITTTFEKQVPGSVPTNRVSIWTVTQLGHPERLFVPLAQPSIYTRGYNLQSSAAPPGLIVTNGVISFARDRLDSHKIGSDSGTLLWVGTNASVRIDSARLPGLGASAYPDSGSTVEIYTNPDPLPYVELETLGPLESLSVGQQISRIVTYQLIRRSQPTPEAEARVILGL